MHKQPIKEVEVRKVVFKDDVPSINVKQKNSIDVNALHVLSHVKLLLVNIMMSTIMMLNMMMCRMVIFNKVMLTMMFPIHNFTIFRFRNH